MIKPEELGHLEPPVIVATHMRSGTHLTIDLIRRQFPGIGSWKFPGESNDAVYLAVDPLGKIEASWGERRAMRILDRSHRPIMKVHWTEPDLASLHETQPHLAQWIDQKGTFVYVVRHPLRVLASLWAWEESHNMASSMSDSAFFDWVEAKSYHWENHFRLWQKRNACNLLRFEDIVSDTASTIKKLETWLQDPSVMKTPLLPPKLKGRWHYRCNRILTTRPSSTEILTSTKASTVDDRFTPETMDIINSVAGDAMAELGYRTNSIT